ncbi:MAG: MogA/MoaB family molybdenum cofactor biosynthesis protein [Thermoplasmataceae archaeon]
MHHRTDDKYDLNFLVVTVSDTRTERNDESGNIMSKLMSDSNRRFSRIIVSNDPEKISNLVEQSDANVIIFIGGTGLGMRDLTSATLRRIMEREIRGFGETFRSRSSLQEIHAILSDASMFAGKGKIVFSLPGSEDAQKVGFDLINDIVDHAYHEAMRQPRRS